MVEVLDQRLWAISLAALRLSGPKTYTLPAAKRDKPSGAGGCACGRRVAVRFLLTAPPPVSVVGSAVEMVPA